MSFLEDLRRAPRSAKAQWNGFIMEYRPECRSIFLFHEGRTDPAFYCGFVEQVKPQGFDVRMVCCGNKREVIKRVADFRLRYKDDPRVLFFVDKDHDDLVGNEAVVDYVHLYTTRAYSIENYICCQRVLIRYLVEVVGLPDMDDRVRRIVAQQYEKNRDALYSAGRPVMAWIIAAREIFSTVNINNIDTSKLFDLDNDLVPQLRGGREGAFNYLAQTTGGQGHQKCVPDDRIEAVISKIEGLEPQTWFRGKQELWYFVKFINFVAEALRGANGVPKRKVVLSENDAIATLGPRAPCPPCLREFLGRTIGKLCSNSSSCTQTV